MNRLCLTLTALWTCVLMVSGALLGCGSACFMDCAKKCNGSPTHACQEACEKENGCRPQEESQEVGAEEVAVARDALTHAASRVYAISSLYYQTNGCQHGAIATDSASRCNSPTETLFARVPTDACPPGATPTLSFTRTEWQSSTTVEVRRVLRTVVDPPTGKSSECADAFPGAKWDGTGAGESWTVPGAKGIGTDVSIEKVSFVAPANGTQAVNLDLRIQDANGNFTGATLIDACAPSGECLFAFFASAHIWEAPGSFMLAMTCAAPPATCGDGEVAGGETCDDGDAASGDGCSATCAVEVGWSCAGAPSACATSCGDGVKAGPEGCDDGNTTSHDGCSSSCTPEVCTWE